jgi:hypothetical protein
MNAPSPIQVLIESRCRDLGLTPVDLVRRGGYQNIAKGLRRLEVLTNGDLESSRGLIARLPEALELPPEVIAEAVRETRRQIHESEEQVYRESFKPHAIILTERRIPSQITFALLTGAPRHLRIDLDLSKPRSTFIHKALSETRLRLHRLGGMIPFFGKVLGLIVNYSPERAVRYDLEGNAVEVLKGAYREGESYLQIGRRKLSPEQASQLFLPNADQSHQG